MPALSQRLEGLLVMTVEGFEGGLELRRQTEWIEGGGLAPSFLGHFRPDVFPQIAEHGHLFAGDIVGHGDARQFDYAALDGVHERKVAHRPGEKDALGIA